MLVNRTMGGGLNAGLSFFLPLGDASAGAVNTTPASAAGSPTATFTRATTAWTKLASGLWASVASGTARSCYLGQSTAVGAYGGYFAEGAGIQLVTPTASIRDMTDASWVKTTMTAAKTSTGIDGVATSCSRVTATGAAATILQTLVAAASSRTYSCFIKRITGVGTIGICQDGATFTDVTAQVNSSTFTRVSLNASQLNAVFGIQLGTNGDAIDVDFNQFESGSFASSPLDAAGAVRNADVLTYVTAGNFSDTAGSAYAEVVCNGFPGPGGRVVGTTGGPGTPLVITGGAAVQMFDNTAPTSASGTVTAGVAAKIASAWTGVATSITRAGSAVVHGAYDGSFNLADLAIGTGQVTAELYGTIKNVRLWTRQLADSQLVGLTT